MKQESIKKKLLEAAEEFLEIKLDTDDINRLFSISQIREYQKGNTILGISENLSSVGLVYNGMVRSYYLDRTGNEITKNFHKEYFLFMDEGLIGYEKSICAYEAIEDSVIMLFDIKPLKKLIKENERFKDLYISALEFGIRYKIRRENDFLMNNATERYLQFERDYPELVNRVKQTHISTYLGITPESLSRIKRTLKGEIYE